MVSFIKQEAEEKANEISVSAEEVQAHFWQIVASGAVAGPLHALFLGSKL